jgi:hypothetical protein
LSAVLVADCPPSARLYIIFTPHGQYKEATPVNFNGRIFAVLGKIAEKLWTMCFAAANLVEYDLSV